MSRQTDIVRMAYARNATEFDRQCVMAGTTNEREYLRDTTGGRRFWPIECHVTSIDTDKLGLNFDQLWAEAYAIYLQMRAENPYGMLPLYLVNPVAAKYATEIQESRRQVGSDDTLAAQIQEWLDQPIGSDLGLSDLPGDEPQYRTEVTLLEIWEDMMGRDRHTYPEREAQMLGRAIGRITGWKPDGRKRTNRYGRQRIWTKVP